MIIIVLGMLAVAIIAPPGRGAWLAAGIPYAGAVALAPIVLRADDEHGFAAIILLFAVVWGTDIAAYFVGRAIGGPKLAPRFSPNKTWSGALGGLGCRCHRSNPGRSASAAQAISGRSALIAIVLSVAAQAGDIVESSLKRRFGVKDSGRSHSGSRRA